MAIRYLFALDSLAPHLLPTRDSGGAIGLLRTANLALQRHREGIEDAFPPADRSGARAAERPRGSCRAANPAGRQTRHKNALACDLRTALDGVVGVDLTRIRGLAPSLALKLVAQCGTDLSAWPTAKHFVSWLRLAPGNKVSGGKLLSARTRRTSNRATSLLRLAAVTGQGGGASIPDRFGGPLGASLAPSRSSPQGAACDSTGTARARGKTVLDRGST